MQEQLNYFGATVFWLYILAALFFTGIILNTLYNLQPAPKSPGHGSINSLWLFSALAALSFATLSFNMINVLINSYTLWSRERSLSLADTTLESIWHWSIKSTLFKDFGNAIVHDMARYLWVEASLLATLAVCLFVSIEGTHAFHTRRRLSPDLLSGQHQQIPRLWAFIGLSQILPVSFTQNLFFIAILRKGRTQSPRPISRKMVVLLSGAYCACLIVAPATAGTEWLIPHILLARNVLVAMQLYRWKQTPDSSGRSEESNENLMSHDGLFAHLTLISTLCGFAQTSLAFLEHSPAEIGRALFIHPAVSSLGCDFLPSGVSYLCWRSIGTTSPAADDKVAK